MTDEEITAKREALEQSLIEAAQALRDFMGCSGVTLQGPGFVVKVEPVREQR